MATYGKINCAFWSSQTVRQLSDDGRLMAIYLLTSAHTTICGAFRLPDGYVIEDLGWPIERINGTLSELSRNGFATRCDATKWVVIHKFLEWNPPQNQNQWKAVFKKAAEVPKQAVWRNGFETVLKRFKQGSETVSTESESESESESEKQKPDRPEPPPQLGAADSGPSGPSPSGPVWGEGLQELIAAGVEEAKARRVVGAMLASWDESAVADALRLSIGKADPVAYANGVLKGRPRKPAIPKAEQKALDQKLATLRKSYPDARIAQDGNAFFVPSRGSRFSLSDLSEVVA